MMRMKRSCSYLIVSLLALVFCCRCNASGAEHEIRSPDGKVTARLICEDSRLSYSLSWNEREIFKNSALSLAPNAEYSVMGAETNSVNTTWETVWGQFSSVHDRCEQMVLKVDASGIQADLICRVYNDGVGFRFVVPEQQVTPNKPVSFVCEYNSDKAFKGWFPNGEREPIGPEPFGSGGRRKMPAVIDAGRGVFLGLLESDLYTAKGSRTAVLSGSQSESKATLTRKGMVTPWRVILLGTQPGALLTSTVPLNLAAECKIEDTSWIKAGKSLWDWRVHGYQAGDFTYGINTASYMRFIDFAAENNIRYFLIDDSWFKKVENGKLIIKPEVDLKKIMDYAKSKAVDIILYYDRHKGKSLGDKALFKLYSEFGASGVKYGFMGDNALFTRTAVEETAANRLLVDFHDNPCPMTGISRTLPNALTREFCHSQQDCRKAFTPTAFLKMAMINALSGPIDQCNGAYGLDGINNGERQKGPLKKNSYNSTVVSETARTLVISSGLIILPDAPEEYEKKADLFEFIEEMPATWDESRVINSKIGEHITTARRTGDQWFVGSVINEQGGVLRMPLDFLQKGKKYTVTFYEDAPDTHYIKNRESCQIRKGQVSSKDIIEAKMAPGGGHCIWIRPTEYTATMNATGAASVAAKNPNIIVVNVDDLGWNDVNYLPGVKSPYYTPNIENLASQGMVFSNGYAASPVCSPTRASLVTGKSNASVKITSHIPGAKGYSRVPKEAKVQPVDFLKELPLEEITFAEVLKEQGYATGFIGKWHLAGEGSVSTKGCNGVIDANFHPDRQGFDINIGGCAMGQPKSWVSPYMNDTIKNGRKGEYLTDRLANEAVSYIKANKDQKFLLYLNPYSVHAPIVAPKERIEFIASKVNVGTSFKEGPAKSKDRKKSARSRNSKLTYAAMVYSVDLMMGKIMETLDELKLADNTLLIFTSDNGGLFDNAPLRDHKGTLYEGGIRVPFIVRWPGVVEAGTHSDAPVISYDIYPTIVAAAGHGDKIPADVEGEDLAPILKGESFEREQPLYWHYPHYHHGGMESLDMGSTIRIGDWKYTYLHKTDKHYLFNLKDDLHEDKNLFKSQPERAKEMKMKLLAILGEVDANMPTTK